MVALFVQRLSDVVFVFLLMVYVCGFHRMMEAVVAACRAVGVFCSVVLEVFMVCGMGTCRGCVICIDGGENFIICI